MLSDFCPVILLVCKDIILCTLKVGVDHQKFRCVYRSRKKNITGFLHDNVNMLLMYSESCEHCSTKTEGDMSCEIFRCLLIHQVII